MKLRRSRRITSEGPKAELHNHRTLLVTRTVVDRTRESFNEFAIRRQEAVAYWHGIENVKENLDLVVAVVIPNATHSFGNYDLSVGEVTRMGHLMAERSMICLAQIHTHPDQMTRHSGYDEARILSNHEGFLSLVVPNYGNVLMRDFKDISVYERTEGAWVLLDRKPKADRIRIIEDLVDLRRTRRR